MSDSAFDDFTPSLTYDQTSGAAPVATSQDATVHADVSGLTNKAQRYVLIMAAQAGVHGVTVAELREKNGSVHHGRISAALTNLHRDGRLAALTERRNHCGIYALPEFVGERETRAPRHNRRTLERDEILVVLEQHVSLMPDQYKCSCGQSGLLIHEMHREHVADMVAEALR